MKAASILLALVVVLSFCGEAKAKIIVDGDHDYTVNLSGQLFGIAGALVANENGRDLQWGTLVFFGPLGEFQVPFTATQGLVGVGLILAVLIVVPAVLTVRWKKKRTAA